jgi:adenylate kinase
MTNFKEFLNEGRGFLSDIDGTLKNVNELLKNIKPLIGTPLLWRGHTVKNIKSGIALIDNKRGDSFYGGVHKKSKDIIKEIGIKNITFAYSGNYHRTTLFGTPHILVPMSKMTPWYSSKIDDVMAAGNEMTDNEFRDISAKDLAKTYKKGTDTNNEVLIDVDEYALINPIMILDIVPQWIEKKMNFKSLIDLDADEKELLSKYQYNPTARQELSDEDDNKVRRVLRKYDAKISARSGSTTTSRIEFHFEDNLDSYDHLYEFMKLFKSYLEWYKNR